MKHLRTLTAGGRDDNEMVIVDDKGATGDCNTAVHSVSRLSRPRKAHPPGGQSYPPPFPNGWYHLIGSQQLQKQTSQYISVLGLHIALFR